MTGDTPSDAQGGKGSGRTTSSGAGGAACGGDDRAGDWSGDWRATVRAGVAPVETGRQSMAVDIEGFSGPLDLLLALARTQKVDLAQISVLELAEQYLRFIDTARCLRLALAADYLVMAAWLTFLKSRLMLPDDQATQEARSAEEMAQRLAFRLMRLDAMREAAARLMARNQLDRDVFARGAPDPIKTVSETVTTVELFDVLRAYAELCNRTVVSVHRVPARVVWSIKDARQRLERLVGPVSETGHGGWIQLDLCLERFMPSPEAGRSALASSFGASLEMAREGVVDLRQDDHFQPIYVRARSKDS